MIGRNPRPNWFKGSKKLKAVKRKKFNIILTGGLAHLFKSSLDYKVKINKDLTMMGLLKIAKEEYE